MNRRDKAIMAAGASALFAWGCSFSVRDYCDPRPIQPGRPPASYLVDVEASSVEFIGNHEPTDDEARDLRNLTADILRARALTSAPGQARALPARFHAIYQVERVVWPWSWTIFCIDLQLLGCPTGKADATAQLEFQVGNDIYVGKGSGSAYGGLYYNAFSGTPQALATAIESAVEKLQFVTRLVPSSPPMPDSDPWDSSK